MKKTNFIIFIIIILSIITTTIMPAFANVSQPKTVYISSAEDLIKLSEDSSIDNWSQDMTVFLNNDINLKDIDFIPIPIFSGTFDGQGNSIRGLSINVEGSNQGLFRYLQKGGVIKNLRIQGVVTPIGEKSTIGGIVGNNQGTLEDCSFSGFVKGKDTVGGLVGWNGSSGMIINSSFNGVIYGESKVGGIVGFNTGTVLRCSNLSNVNTTVEDDKLGLGDISDITMDNINLTQLVIDAIDIGGIAGVNSGIIQSSDNHGKIGYPHVGYNIGGIVGRQSGYITKCFNYGNVYGRKEVAGIVGQIEPHISTTIGSSNLNQLQKELDALDSSITNMIGSTKNLSDVITQNLSLIQNDIDVSKIHIESLIGQTETKINTGIEEINKISVIGVEVLDKLIPITESLTKTIETMGKAMSPMKNALYYINRAMDESEYMSRKFEGLPASLEDSIVETNKAIEKLNKAYTTLLKVIRLLCDEITEEDIDWENINWDNFDWEDINWEDIDWENIDWGDFDWENIDWENIDWGDFNWEDIDWENIDWGDVNWDKEDLINILLKSVYSNIKSAEKDLKQAVINLKPFFNELVDIINSTDDIISSLKDIIRFMGYSMNYMIDAINIIETSIDGIAEIFKEFDEILVFITEQEKLEFPTIDDDYQKTTENLFESIDDISKSLSGFISDITTEGNQLIDYTQAVSDQLFSVTNVMIDIITEISAGDITEENIVKDVSQDDIENQTKGKVSDCNNLGIIEGDLNVGGIAGGMSIELKLDPEVELNLKGKLSYNTIFETRAIIYKCENQGSIIAKKNSVGGIVGNMTLGYIRDCIVSGSVESLDGHYVGGIAGKSDAPIVSSYVRCRLDGGNYIGGISGYGKEILESYSFVEVGRSKACVGAIAGNIDENSNIKSNYFVSDVLRGIDGISYVNKAEPITYEKLISTTSIPNIFKDFKCNFWVDDKIIKTLHLNYGDPVSQKDYPEIPDKEDHYAVWEELSIKNIKFDTDIHALYFPYLTLLESVEKRNGPLPIILVEGSFIEGDFLSLKEDNSKGPLLEEKSTLLEQWNVIIPKDGETIHNIRYLPPKIKDNLDVYLLSNGKWIKTKSQLDGKYLVFKANGNNISFSVVDKGFPYTKYIPLIFILILILIISIFFIKGAKKKKSKDKSNI